jgi:hypothetical protein
MALIGPSPKGIVPDVHGTYNQRVRALRAALASPATDEGTARTRRWTRKCAHPNWVECDASCAHAPAAPVEEAPAQTEARGFDSWQTGLPMHEGGQSCAVLGCAGPHTAAPSPERQAPKCERCQGRGWTDHECNESGCEIIRDRCDDCQGTGRAAPAPAAPVEEVCKACGNSYCDGRCEGEA